MQIVIQDTWFPSKAKITIGPGHDDLVFIRCTFEGGEICVEHSIDRPVFRTCLFQGTIFTRQPLSERIASECHWTTPLTEAAAREGYHVKLGVETVLR